MTGFLVTGGAGFIGSNFVHRAVAAGRAVVNLDALTYAGNQDNLAGLQDCAGYSFFKGSINDRALVRQLLSQHRPSAIVNFAAETHVDRSIDDAGAFIRTNVNGTYELLEAALSHWRALPPDQRAGFRFLHISSDEVYGSIASGRFTETSRYAPNSPYAASKAAADHLVRAFNMTYGLPTLLTNSGNNYGARQYPEKLIPHMILSALQGNALPLYGDGKQVRDWLHVDDHCDALMRVIEAGRPGETYNVGGHGEHSNIEVVHAICDVLDAARPGTASHRGMIAHVTDRPGHDRRYSLDTSKLERELGWRPAIAFETGLSRTVAWYLDNMDWCERIMSGGYRMQRLGLDRVG